MTKEIEISITDLRRTGGDTIENMRHHKERVITANCAKSVAAIISIEDLVILKSV